MMIQSTVLLVLLETSLLLLCCAQGLSAFPSIDVCKTCHPNATCIEKDSKYSCMCNFGLIGNGRTHCVDKDECKVGAQAICGEHTACHNTHGSYYCICLKGYRPSNNHDNFIPNDGTFCTDIDECEDSDICGYNGKCKNIPGSYECYCKEGYRLQNGTEPFQANGILSLCKEVDCGQPPAHPHSKMVLSGNTTFGNHVTYMCTSGFLADHGINMSVCTAKGTWEGATVVCTDIDECEDSDICGYNGKCKNIPGSYECYCKEGYRLQNGTEPFQANGILSLCKEVDCGQPPAHPHSKMVLSGNTTFGNHVTYMCTSGFLADHGINMSVCTAKGTWEGATVVCTDIDECEVPEICGVNGQCTNVPGSYKCYCKEGYKLQNGTELFQIKVANTLCQAVDCGQPVALPYSEMILSGNTTFGSQVTYTCISGFFVKDGHNTSICTANGTWEGATIECTVIDCGPPPELPNSHMDPIINTTFENKVVYRCDHGFIADNYRQNTSICSADGTWDGALIACKAVDCGPPLAMQYAIIHSLKNTTFGSSVTFVCSKGFIAVSGYNSSICTAAGRWEGANLECKVAECGPPPSIQYATPGFQWNTPYGSTINFECLSGYIMDSGNKTATCNEDGKWVGANLVCRAIDCGQPALVPNTEMKWNGTTNLGSEVQYTCQKGFYNPDIWHISRCTSNETWEKITLFCTEIDCGRPLYIEHADWMWNNQSTLGSYVYYKCKPGFKDNGAKKFTRCLENGTWEGLNLTCTVKEDLISNLLIFNETCLQWKKSSDIFGWEILYEFGIFGVRWHNKDFVDKKTFNYTTDNEYPFVCLELLPDTNYTITMAAVSPELPVIKLNVIVQTTMKQAFGNILVFNETCLTWTRSPSPVRSLEVYTVFINGRTWSSEGLFQNIMFNFSTDKVTPVLCLDLPSAAEYLINITESSTERSAHVNLNMTTYESENSRNRQIFNETCLLWNRSLDGLQEIYKLYVQGGRWSPEELFQDLLFSINTDQSITAVCLDIPMDTQYPTNVTGALSNLAGGEPIQNVTVFNENCLIWRRHSRLKELYVFFVHGYRWYQKDFMHRVMFNVTTDEENPVVCLELQNGTNYTVDVVSTFYPQYPAQIDILTPISEPPLPKLKIVPENGQLLKIRFQRADKTGPISSYQVFVIQLTSWCSFNCESLEAVTYYSNISKTQGYVSAEFFPGDASNHLEFSIGDRQYYGDFYNAPLQRGKDYCIILRTITKMRTQTCMVMAEVEELSTSRHHMTVVLLGSIAFACLIVLMSYSTARCCKR